MLVLITIGFITFIASFAVSIYIDNLRDIEKSHVKRLEGNLAREKSEFLTWVSLKADLNKEDPNGR